MGRKKHTLFTDEDLTEALTKYKGLVGPTARYLGCCEGTVYKRINSSPVLAQHLKQCRRAMFDLAEEKLIDCVRRREGWAISRVLTAFGREHGYTDRIEHRHGGDSSAPPIEHKVGFVPIDSLNLPLAVREQILDAMKLMESLNGQAKEGGPPV